MERTTDYLKPERTDYAEYRVDGLLVVVTSSIYPEGARVRSISTGCASSMGDANLLRWCERVDADGTVDRVTL